VKRLLLSAILITLVLSACGSQPTDLSPLPIIDPGVDPESWVTIPAGEFLMGLHQQETIVDYNYEIMVTDVTKMHFAAYLNQALADGSVKIAGKQVVGYYPGDDFHAYEHELEIRAGDWPHLPLNDPGLRLDFDDSTFTAQAGYENHPMTMVTWFGAKAFCDFFGYRLPTEIEWEKAARGPDGRPFPWGNEIEPRNANYYSSHDIFEKIIGGMGDTTPVGFYNGDTYADYTTIDSPSPYGLYDMAGNVWQWTDDVYENQHYRYMRGGSKDNYSYNLRVWTRNSAGPEYFSPGVGFRCARDEE
jgi:formylglycine-generating enzyme required for sulfatase activity